MGKKKAFLSLLCSYKSVSNNILIIFFTMYNTKPHSSFLHIYLETKPKKKDMRKR